MRKAFGYALAGFCFLLWAQFLLVDQITWRPKSLAPKAWGPDWQITTDHPWPWLILGGGIFILIRAATRQGSGE